MRRFFMLAPAVLLFAVALPAHAANLPLLDPNFTIVPNGCLSCPCSFAAVLQLIQNLTNAAVSLGVLAFVLLLAYAGFSFMVNPTNPEARNRAKSMLLNVVIGLVIVLAAWLFVDFIMKTLYNPDTTSNGVKYGPWNQILDTDTTDPCIQATTPHALPGISNVVNGLVNGGANQVLGTAGSGACNATAVATAAASGGVRMTTGEANTLACLAGPESQCGAILQNYNWNGAQSSPPSTAYGPFQITLKGNSQCFNNSVCSQAANVSAPLNCANAFDSHGYPIAGTLLNECETAAANLACSAVAADCVYRTQGAGAWTADPNSAKQQSCINSSGA